MQIQYFVITFVKIVAMTTSVNIIKIGNSCGIILPAKVMKALGVKERDTLNISVSSGEAKLVQANVDPFAAISAGGWYEDTRDAHEISEELHSARGNTRKVEAL